MNTKLIFPSIITGISFFTFLGFYISYQKWLATWWEVNVLIFAFFLAIPLAFGCKFFLEHYLTNNFPGTYLVKNRFFTLLGIGTLSFILMGIMFTEPNKKIYEQQQKSRLQAENTIGQSSDGQVVAVTPIEHKHTHKHYYYGDRYNDGYRYSRHGDIDWGFIGEFFSGSSDSGGSSSDSEGSGELILFIIVAAITVAMIIGSAFVQHFWVFACIWSIMLLILYLHNNISYLKAKDDPANMIRNKFTSLNIRW